MFAAHFCAQLNKVEWNLLGIKAGRKGIIVGLIMKGVRHESESAWKDILYNGREHKKLSWLAGKVAVG